MENLFSEKFSGRKNKEPQRIIRIQTDGGCMGNPGGPYYGGAVIFWPDGTTEGYGWYFGNEGTNNQAEFLALEFALQKVISKEKKLEKTKIIIESDSILMVNCVKELWKLKNEELKKIRKNIYKALDLFFDFSINYIPREYNRLADQLAQKAFRLGWAEVFRSFEKMVPGATSLRSDDPKTPDAACSAAGGAP